MHRPQLYRLQYQKKLWGIMKKFWWKKMFSLKIMTKLEDLMVLGRWSAKIDDISLQPHGPCPTVTSRFVTENQRGVEDRSSFFALPMLRDSLLIYVEHGVTKKCRLSWLTNTALLYEPKGGERGELRALSLWVQLYTGAQINFWISNSVFNLWCWALTNYWTLVCTEEINYLPYISWYTHRAR